MASAQHPYSPADVTKWTGGASPAATNLALDQLALRAKTLEAGAGTGGFTYVRKTADQSVTSSTTLVDDNALQFNIGANETWHFEYVLHYEGASAGDIKAGVNAPAGATGWVSINGYGVTASAAFDVMGFAGNADVTDTGAGTRGAIGTSLGFYLDIVVKGFVVNGSTPGIVKARWAQGTSSGTATTVKAGSWLMATRVSPVQPVGANYGAMQLVQRQELTAAATSITFSGLDLNSDEKYIIVFCLKNATGTGQNISLTYNGDTTAANYRREDTNAVGANDAVITAVDTASNGATSGTIEIFKPVSGERVRAVSTWMYGPFSTAMQTTIVGHQWTTTGANVTLFTLTHPTASGFAIGSYASLYRLSPVPVSTDGFREVVAQADQDIASSTTLVTDNELFFTMEANKLYEFEGKIVYSSPVGGGTPDFKGAFTGPATLTGNRDLLVYISVADATNSGTGQDSLTAAMAVGTATTPRLLYVRGWAYSTTGGTGSSGFQFQWAQNTSSANATRRHLGSMLRWQKYG